MNYQPDLFGGARKERPEPTTRAQNLSQARQEMMDTNSATLFDALSPGSEAPTTQPLFDASTGTYSRMAADDPRLAARMPKRP